ALNVSAQTMGEITEKYNEAGAALQAKEFEKAAEVFAQVIDEAATVEEAGEILIQSQRYLPTALLFTGRTLAAAQQYDAAIEKLTEARDRAEMYGNDQVERQSTQMIGQIYFASGADAYNNERYSEAVEIFAKGFEADPTNTDMALNLARSYDKLDDLEQSVEVYNSIIALEGRHSRYVEAVAEAKKEVSEAVLVRAAAAGAAGNLEEVVRLTELIPEDAAGALLKVQVANNKKDYRSVIQYAPEAAELQTDEEKKSEINFYLGAAYQNTDNTAKAIESFRKVTAGPNAAQARQMVSDLSK
ncbi:MAG: tetratricopeptide repeat protein, partial [Rikenellaceae bacterium]|nr:tetratricopeptide repeat protein [Rikenellaceae bacterium]